MDLDVQLEPPDLQEASLFDLPEEIQLKFLLLLEPLDILSLGRTCKFYAKYADNETIWRFQWGQLSSQLPRFTFPPVTSLEQLGVLFKDCCRRLWSILAAEGGLYPQCIHCRQYTCSQDCLEERSAKIVLDIGGKLTWLINANFGLKKHMSMIAVPKLLRCYDCDSFIDRTGTQAHCDCHSQPTDCLRLLPASRAGGLYCRNSSLASHTRLEYCSQRIDQLPHQRQHDRPLCLFCEEFRTNRLLCEKEMVLSTKDTASILDAVNLDLVSPLIALEHTNAFPVVKAFLEHIFSHFKMIDELQRPNSCLVFTEPSNLPLAVKELLLKYLFEEVQVSRLCLMPKALAISLLFDRETCVVIDSGATSTSVWVVLEGRVETNRTRTVPVGGWHVSQFLKQALTWKEHKDAISTTVSSFDSCSVKQKCRLSLHLGREEARTRSVLPETLHVRSQRGRGGKGSSFMRSDGGLEVTEINLSHELYLAPEMMYASLDLAGLVAEATKDLPSHLLKDCFSNILVQGGNTDLEGFSARLSCDLREALPEQSSIINVRSYPTGNHSWNTAMGANMAKVPPKYEDVLMLHQPGTPFWISREEYILFGSHQLTELGDVQEM